MASPFLNLIEIAARDPIGGASVAIRATEPPGYVHASAPGYFAPNAQQTLRLVRSVRREGSVLGRSEVDWGQCTLGSAGDLDTMRGLEFGRSFTVRRGLSEAAYSSFWTVASGIAESVEVGLDRVTVTLRDGSRDLDQRLATATLGGTNVGTVGIDGSAEQKGQIKPRAFGGRIREAEPLLLNAALLIYGVNFDRAGNPAPVNTFHGVKSRAGDLAFGADYANLTALQAASLTGGTYATCKALGLVRLGSGAATNLGTVTVDFTVASTVAARRAGAMIQAALLDTPGIVAGDIVGADFTALDAAAPYELGGFYATGAETTRDLVDAACNSVLAYLVTDRFGRFRCGRLTAPEAVAPVCTLTRSDGPDDALAADAFGAIDFEPAPLQRESAQPFTRVRVNYQRVWTVQAASQILQSVVAANPALTAYLGSEYRSTAYADASVSWGAAREFDLDTLIENESDALTLRGELLAAYGVPRYAYRLTFPLDETFVDLVDLGAVVSVRWPRFGLDAGKRGRVIGQEIAIDETGAILVLTVQV